MYQPLNLQLFAFPWLSKRFGYRRTLALCTMMFAVGVFCLPYLSYLADIYQHHKQVQGNATGITALFPSSHH
jgi:MFS family permease